MIGFVFVGFCVVADFVQDFCVFSEFSAKRWHFWPFFSELCRAGQNAGLTVSVLAWDGVALAVFAVGDQLKSDAAETITNLKSMGITPWLVTGDSAEVAAAVALTVGIDSEHVVSAAMPETKLVIVEKLKAQGHCVLMIGDGINDAAALTAADLSMAMGTGTDTAISSADITLMNSGLGSVISALKLSQKTLKIIRLNMGWALICL